MLRTSKRPCAPKDRDQKFTEPVALSSTFPVNLRLPPTALGSGFDLLALRARCKNNVTRRPCPGKACGRENGASLRARGNLYHIPRPLAGRLGRTRRILQSTRDVADRCESWRTLRGRPSRDVGQPSVPRPYHASSSPGSCSGRTALASHIRCRRAIGDSRCRIERSPSDGGAPSAIPGGRPDASRQLSITLTLVHSRRTPETGGFGPSGSG